MYFHLKFGHKKLNVASLVYQIVRVTSPGFRIEDEDETFYFSSLRINTEKFRQSFTTPDKVFYYFISNDGCEIAVHPGQEEHKKKFEVYLSPCHLVHSTKTAKKEFNRFIKWLYKEGLKKQ